MQSFMSQLRDNALFFTRGLVTVDPMLHGLGQAYTFLGRRGLEVIMLGLSRKIRASASDARKVISEWELRDQTCCFQGGMQDLLGLSDTFFIALSYKHDPESEWIRKGDRFISKMSQRDQDDLVRAIDGVSKLPGYDFVIVWCDQIISTKLQNMENSLGWYNAGILPYACLPVLKLSTYIPEDILESRLWIKVERSLGRLGYGTIDSEDATSGFYGSLGDGPPLMELINTLSQMILSGYWPADLGYWKQDYQQMKTWAISVLGDTSTLINPPIFDEIKGLDNLKLLANTYSLMTVPRGLENEEVPSDTVDSLFFLKATAWNLFIAPEWQESNRYVSHYMGYLGSFCKFSWWRREGDGTIFGCMLSRNGATGILAMQTENGYRVYRRPADPELYSHADQYATDTTLRILEEIVLKCNLPVTAGGKWGLLYSSADDFENHKCDPLVKKAMGSSSGRFDVTVPLPFVGMTTKLYRSAVAKQGEKNSSVEVAKQMLGIFDRWNCFVRKSYDRWISVSDTTCGPIWLEGYTEDHVSFGFYDFLTRSIILGDRRPLKNCISLPSKWEFVQEVRRVASVGAADSQILVDELYGRVTAENHMHLVSVKDIAMFMTSGGFTSKFDAERLCNFLCRVAENRKYWSTRIYSKAGRLQVIFSNAEGRVRIAQRETVLPDFHAHGIARRGDSAAVESVSLPIKDDQNQHRAMMYWKSMDANASLRHFQERFTNSIYKFEDGRNVLLIDFTVLEDFSETEKSVLGLEEDKADEDALEELAQTQANKFHEQFPTVTDFQHGDIHTCSRGQQAVPDLQSVIVEADEIEGRFPTMQGKFLNLIPKTFTRTLDKFVEGSSKKQLTKIKDCTPFLFQYQKDGAPFPMSMEEFSAVYKQMKKDAQLRAEIKRQFEILKQNFRDFRALKQGRAKQGEGQ